MAGYGARDIAVTITAVNNASAAIDQVAQSTQQLTAATRIGGLQGYAYGVAFDKVGHALEGAGKAILSALAGSAQAAMDFQHEMALANTQAHLGVGAFRQISQQALNVSSRFGVAATDIAKALYDIFSTTNQTAGEAIQSVKGLARATVAGATDMRTVTRGVVDIQNAFGDSAGNTTDILNLQFQMLRKSAGTYDQLVSAFGNVISAASQMDQSIQTAAGSIAFLTLRGRTQAQASISVSRALDQISRHGQEMQQVLGVSVFDASGKFRQLGDIITDMGHAMAGMTSKQRAQAFYDMFGQGSIQANRFFRLAVPQFKDLNASIDEMSKKKVADQLQRAFRIMKREDPTYILNRLRESAKNLGIEIVTTLAPAFRSAVKWLQNIVDWFRRLSPETKELLGRLLLIGGAFLLVSGKVFIVIGAFMKFYSLLSLAAGMMTTMGGTAVTTGQLFMRMAGMMGGTLLVIGLIAGAAYLIIKNWKPISAFWKRNWDTIKVIAAGVGTFLIILLATRIPAAISTLAGALTGTGKSGLVGAATTAIGSIKDFIRNIIVARQITGSWTTAIMGAISPATAWAAAIALVVAAGVKINQVMNQGKAMGQGWGNQVNNNVLSLSDLRAQIDAAENSTTTWMDTFPGLSEWMHRLTRDTGEDGWASAVQTAHDHLNKLFDSVTVTRDGLGTFYYAMYKADNITNKEAREIARLINGYENLHGPLDATTAKQIQNYLAMGDVHDALKLLLEKYKDAAGPLKGFANDSGNVAQHQQEVYEKTSKVTLGLRAQAAAARAAFSPIRSLGSAMDDLAQAEQEAASKGAIVAQILANLPSNVHVPNVTRGGGGGGGVSNPHQFQTGGRVLKSGWGYVHAGEYVVPKQESTGNRNRGGDVHIHVEPQKSTIDAPELAAEIDWLWRTRGW